MKNSVLAFGEALWDLLPGGAVLGGAPLNFAFYLNTLGIPSLPVSSLGTDELGRRARERIGQLGMDDSFVFSSEEHPTGRVSVEFDDLGEPVYTIETQTAYDYIPRSRELLKAASECRALCFGTLAQRGRESRETLRELLKAADSSLRVYDVNLRTGNYTEEIIQTSLKAADICKLNGDEMRELDSMFGLRSRDLRRAAQYLARRFNLNSVIVTMGKQGAFAVEEGGDPVVATGYTAAPGGDPCGAGDAFTAGFLRCVLEGLPLEQALRFGNAMGALVAGRIGATAAVERAEIDAFLKRGTQFTIKDADFALASRTGGKT